MFKQKKCELPFTPEDPKSSWPFTNYAASVHFVTVVSRDIRQSLVTALLYQSDPRYILLLRVYFCCYQHLSAMRFCAYPIAAIKKIVLEFDQEHCSKVFEFDHQCCLLTDRPLTDRAPSIFKSFSVFVNQNHHLVLFNQRYSHCLIDKNPYMQFPLPSC